MTQVDLAAKVAAQGTKMDGDKLARIERGVRRASLNESLAISNALDADLHEMCDPYYEGIAAAETVIQGLRKSDREIINQVHAIIGFMEQRRELVERFRDRAWNVGVPWEEDVIRQVLEVVSRLERLTIDAVDNAVEYQKYVSEHRAKLNENRRIELERRRNSGAPDAD